MIVDARIPGRRTAQRLAFCLALSVIAAFPGRAGADPARTGPVIITFLALTPATVGVFVPIIGNSVYLGRGRRPPRPWVVTGYVFGSLELAGAVGMTVFAATASENREDGWIYAASAGGLAALGIVCMTVTGLAARLPENLALHPTALLDSQSRWSPGVALTLSRW